MKETPAWLARAHPAVPAAVRARLGAIDGPVRPGGETLLENGLEALRRALDPRGLERQGAFELLAADALLTWAAEAALRRGDPAAELGAMVERVAEAYRPASEGMPGRGG